MRKALVFLVFFPVLINAQIDSSFIKDTELQLMKYFNSLSVIKHDNEQNRINDSILQYFTLILYDKISFHYPFDSLKTMGKISDDDNEINFYTWNIPFEDGSHMIQGIIQYKVNKDSVSFLILHDSSDELENAEMLKLGPNKWYGALYYEVLTKKINKQKFYFLMGYNPGNLFSNKKVLDVFYFDEYGYPFFGLPVFNINNKLQNRLILTYNEKASITLHYNKKLKQIIFHHLVPIDSKYKDNPMFYGPDFTFDGLEFKDDTWNLIEKVDVRNDY